MANDYRKLKDEAAQHSAKGKHRKAADLYVELGRHEPNDPLWPHRAGEALRRAGAPREAIAQLVGAAEGYAKNGFLLKAISVAKMILEIDPGHGETQSMLASLYAKRDARPSAERTSAPAVSISMTNIPTSSPGMPPVAAVPVPARTDRARAFGPGTGTGTKGPPPIPQLSQAAPAVDPRVSHPTIELDVEEPSPRSTIEIDLDESTPLDNTLPPEHFLSPVIELDDASTPGPPPIELPTVAPPAKPAAPTKPLTLDEIGIDLLPAAITQPPRRIPTIDRLPLSQVIPGSRITDEFSMSAFEIPLSPDDLLMDGEAAPLPRIPLFSSLDETRLRTVIERSRIAIHPPGDMILRQGAPGDSLFVIVRGEVSICLDGVGELATLGEGSFFGELALLTDQPRQATVIALADTELLEIGRDLVWELIEDAPDVLQTMLTFFRDRLLERLIAMSPLFQPFSGGEAQTLARRFQFLEMKVGTALVTEGERSDGLFVLLCGQAEASRGNQVIHALGPGDLCGELSLLTRQPSLATVKARTRLWALGLPRAAFQELIMIYPQVLIYVNEVAEARRADVEKHIPVV